MFHKQQVIANKEYFIHTSLAEDSSEGKIYILDTEIEKEISGKRNLACIQYKHEQKKKKIYCEILYVDKYYKEKLDKNKCSVNNQENINKNTASIFINEWYRNILEIDALKECELEISIPNKLHKLWAKLYSYPNNHPQIIVRTANMLGIIGIGLGVIGIGLGLLSIGFAIMGLLGRILIIVGVIINVFGILGIIAGVIGIVS